MPLPSKQRVLAVCLGNICRSPLAEIILRHQAEQSGLDRYFEFASAGTGDWHVGGVADPRSAATASLHGMTLKHHRARQITARNVSQWDWFIAMDRNNHRDLLHMGVDEHHLLLMRQFEDPSRVLDVPDPYYGGDEGFEQVWQLLQQNALSILQYLGEQHEKNHGNH